jgi:hypothetical protein
MAKQKRRRKSNNDERKEQVVNKWTDLALLSDSAHFALSVSSLSEDCKSHNSGSNLEENGDRCASCTSPHSRHHNNCRNTQTPAPTYNHEELGRVNQEAGAEADPREFGGMGAKNDAKLGGRKSKSQARQGEEPSGQHMDASRPGEAVVRMEGVHVRPSLSVTSPAKSAQSV